ncbi:MAG: type II toxin-antitoxin system PemK/MazF family toxin [Dehalococcoidia bacterium]|uniref:type II toxin-antitoxin system PemK/MazF family toxin n=1 Tax=Candidatus Amarobacter glycogenicus TaxID=3140699 RepID=UPI0031368E5B|nr:type II toxin-antitoxin system PemK/MazF family toxin [Dehalococcoidia bacterium]
MRQGEVYWVLGEEPYGSKPGYRRPWLVVQNNLTNATLLNTVLACPLTSNMRRAQAPGNVVLRRREGGLPNESVVQVVGLSPVERTLFDELIGAVSSVRLGQVLAGIMGVLEPREP